jgi:hypothetical protein
MDMMMNSVKKEFVNYEQSLKLKELGFDEECFGYYTGDKMHLVIKPSMGRINVPDTYVVTAPTFSQSFRWFREEYGLKSWIEEHIKETFIYEIRPHITEDYKIGEQYVFGRHEETEFACLNKLIEIVEKRGVGGKYKNGVPINWD